MATNARLRAKYDEFFDGLQAVRGWRAEGENGSGRALSLQSGASLRARFHRPPGPRQMFEVGLHLDGPRSRERFDLLAAHRPAVEAQLGEPLVVHVVDGRNRVALGIAWEVGNWADASDLEWLASWVEGFVPRLRAPWEPAIHSALSAAWTPTVRSAPSLAR